MKRSIVLLSAIAGLFMGTSALAQDNSELIAVYRWYNPTDKNYVTLAENQYPEGQLLNWKYKDKTLLFYAFTEPGPNRVAVNSWFNPVTKDQVSVCADEYSDDDLLKMGYTDKLHQFYVSEVRMPNRVAVYRWHLPKTNDWVTIPEEGNTDTYYKKGYKRKTFQFYAIRRTADEALYNGEL
ncbi:MAG TPA: hypothetical protein PKX92_02600 [Edaphocola sp.]|nr:hypothetical protein [Edaphocola sp.]